MSYSYAHTARHQAPRFLYEIIGTEGLIRYDHDDKVFELRTARGTENLPFDHERNFEGMYAAYAHAMETGVPGHLSTAENGEAAARIAIEATAQAMAGRRREGTPHRSSIRPTIRQLADDGARWAPRGR